MKISLAPLFSIDHIAIVHWMWGRVLLGLVLVLGELFRVFGLVCRRLGEGCLDVENGGTRRNHGRDDRRGRRRCLGLRGRCQRMYFHQVGNLMKSALLLYLRHCSVQLVVIHFILHYQA